MNEIRCKVFSHTGEGGRGSPLRRAPAKVFSAGALWKSESARKPSGRMVRDHRSYGSIAGKKSNCHNIQNDKIETIYNNKKSGEKTPHLSDSHLMVLFVIDYPPSAICYKCDRLWVAVLSVSVIVWKN